MIIEICAQTLEKLSEDPVNEQELRLLSENFLHAVQV